MEATKNRLEKLRKRIRRTDNPKTYFVANQQGQVKIGKSINPFERFKALQATVPGATLLGICDDSKVHSLFKELRLARGWFELTDTLRTWIQENAEVPEMQS